MKRYIRSLLIVWVCICVLCTPLVAFAGGVGDGGSESGGEAVLPGTVRPGEIILTGILRNESSKVNHSMDWLSDTNKYGYLCLSGYLYSLQIKEGPIRFHSGLFYTVDFSGWIFKRSNSSSIPADEIIATIQMHLHSTNGYWVSSRHNILSGGVLAVPAVSWYCTETFDCDAIYFSFEATDGSVSEVYVAVPQMFTYSYQTQIQQIEGVLSGQTDRIIIGEGLKPPAGIPDEKKETEDTLNDYTTAEKDVETAIGGGGFGGAKDQLDSIMQLPALGTDFTAAFAKINTVFSRVVSTFDLSVALTFMLIFGLALFVIGRRVR